MHVGERQLLREMHRRTAEKVVPAGASRLGDLLATRFDKQRGVLSAKGRRVAALCTRRAGKTELVPAKLYQVAENHPGTVLYYVAITAKRARELMWKPLLNANDTFGLGWKTNETRLTLSKGDGEIRLVGADDMRELEKRRGDKASVVVVDEAQSFPPDVLRALLEDVLGPALVDVRGSFLLLGTPGMVCAGYWYEITRNDDEESRTKRDGRWEVFEWSGLDNPHVAENFRLEVEERDGIYGPLNPTTLREYRGQWVSDANALFYSYSPARNVYDGALPPGHTWLHVMGVDLGFDDPFAIEVLAFSYTHPIVYEVDSFKQSGLTPSEWATHIRARKDRYNPIRLVVDTGGLGKAFVEEMKSRHKLPAEPAQKQNKLDFAKLLNDDLLAGKVKALEGGGLASEWAVLPKDPDDPTREHPGFHNHCTDAALYAWRECRHFLATAPKQGPTPGTPEALEARMQAYEDRLAEEIEARLAEEREEASWD